MRTVKNFQTLTTGIVDYNGNQIPPDVIEWEDYDKNPVLLYDKKNEGHGGVVVGKVIDRKRIDNGFAGRLSFMERNEDADIAYEKYTQGVLNFVSIGGFAAGEEKNGVFVALRYRPREFSLVKFPANIQAKKIDASTLSPEETTIYNNLSDGGKIQVRYLTMGCEFMEENVTVEAAEQTQETTVEETTVEAGEQTVEETTVEETTVEETTVEAAEQTTVEETTVEETTVEASEQTQETTVEETTVEASEQTQETTTQVEASQSSTQIPNGMEWHERNSNTNNTTLKYTNMKFKELKCDADFQRRLMALQAAFRSGANTVDASPENAETMRVLAASMLEDEKMVILAAATNVTNGVTKGRNNALNLLVNCAAGGAAAATLEAADLGVISYLSMIYTQLLANDTFRRAVRFVPMSDRTGAIYIESGIQAPTFVGNVTAINTQRYFYDDIKRTIARKVFSFAPICFQHADMAVLAYDKLPLGVGEQMDRTFADISTYWLQVIANTPNIGKIMTTGLVGNSSTPRTMKTKGLFPIEAPLSDLEVYTPVLDDIIALEGHFLMQNYRLENKRVEMVLPSRLYSALASDPENRNQLTRELNANLGSYINFSATRVTPRNPVARYNTASNAPELDPSMYADNNVADNGTFTATTPATTTAAHVGAGVAFVENEVIAGVGSIELITMPDPQNYGTTISGWVSTGCTVARQNGVGAALLVPTVKPTEGE